jgi:hypothetical protein
MMILKNPWDESLYNLIKNSKNKLLIISPYIKANAINFMLESYNGNTKSVRVLTRFSISDICDGASDLDAYKMLIKQDIPVRCVTNLHAKVYLSENEVIITSSNMTMTGLLSNLEFGVKLTNKKLISEIEEYFNLIWQKAEELKEVHIERCAEILASNKEILLEIKNKNKSISKEKIVGTRIRYPITRKRTRKTIKFIEIEKPKIRVVSHGLPLMGIESQAMQNEDKSTINKIGKTDKIDNAVNRNINNQIEGNALEIATTINAHEVEDANLAGIDYIRLRAIIKNVYYELITSTTSPEEIFIKHCNYQDYNNIFSLLNCFYKVYGFKAIEYPRVKIFFNYLLGRLSDVTDKEMLFNIIRLLKDIYSFLNKDKYGNRKFDSIGCYLAINYLDSNLFNKFNYKFKQYENSLLNKIRRNINQEVIQISNLLYKYKYLQLDPKLRVSKLRQKHIYEKLLEINNYKDNIQDLRNIISISFLFFNENDYKVLKRLLAGN